MGFKLGFGFAFGVIAAITVVFCGACSYFSAAYSTAQNERAARRFEGPNPAAQRNQEPYEIDWERAGVLGFQDPNALRAELLYDEVYAELTIDRIDMPVPGSDVYIVYASRRGMVGKLRATIGGEWSSLVRTAQPGQTYWFSWMVTDVQKGPEIRGHARIDTSRPKP